MINLSLGLQLKHQSIFTVFGVKIMRKPNIKYNCKTEGFVTINLVFNLSGSAMHIKLQ